MAGSITGSSSSRQEATKKLGPRKTRLYGRANAVEAVHGKLYAWHRMPYTLSSEHTQFEHTLREIGYAEKRHPRT